MPAAVTGGGAAAKGKAGKAAGGKGGAAAGASRQREGGGEGSAAAAILQVGHLAGKLVEWHPDMDGAGGCQEACWLPGGWGGAGRGKACREPGLQACCSAHAALAPEAAAAQRRQPGHLSRPRQPPCTLAGDGEDLPTALAELLRPAAAAAYQAALQAALTAGADERRRAKEAAARALEDAHQRLQLYASGAALLQVRSAALLRRVQ
jgi:hypothetical protein